MDNTPGLAASPLPLRRAPVPALVCAGSAYALQEKAPAALWRRAKMAQIIGIKMIGEMSTPKQLSGGTAMSPKTIGILSVAGMCVFVGAYYLVGHMLILYLLFATAVLLGPILFLVGLHKLYARLSKRLRCKEETQGYVVDYILSPWKYANPHRRPHRSRNYYYRWFPVVEYEVDGQRLRQKNKISFLTASDERPVERMTPLRYDPKHPKRFYLPEGPNEFSSSGWISTVLFLFVGGMFIPFSALAILFFAGWITGNL